MISKYLNKKFACGVNNFMNVTLTVVFVLIMLAHSYAAVIEMEMPKEMQLSNPPQTQEDLLRRLKKVYDTPGVPGHEVVMQLTGFDVNKTEIGSRNYRLNGREVIRLKKWIIKGTNNQKNIEKDKTAIRREFAQSETPVMGNLYYYYFNQDSYLLNLEKIDKIQCMNPETTIKILGSPAEVKLYNANICSDECGPPDYRVRAIYEHRVGKLYKLIYLTYKRNFKTKEQAKDMIMNYSTNKDDCVMNIRIETNYQ